MDTSSRDWAISSLDGRYGKELEELRCHTSEAARNRFRLMVEAAWLLHLKENPKISDLIVISEGGLSLLRKIASGNGPDSLISDVKSHEKTTNHDVKALEYTLRDALLSAGSDQRVVPWIHFACTSEDINNLSYGLMLKTLRSETLLPLMDQIISGLTELAWTHKDLPMLSRTHGQTATPTTLGKEMAVFVRRLQRQRERFLKQEIEGKINGAVGNFNAHVIAFPDVDWIEVSKKFVSQSLGLAWNPLTTQIEPHDSYVEYMEVLRHINMVMLDFSRDMWGYISLGYFAQKTLAGEVGSSTMPHKVNPIYFENAEGNIGVANALFAHFGEKLPVSRYQRDLSDSTVLRVTGTAVGHAVLAWKSLLKGLSRVEANPTVIACDLDESWEVLAEAVQTVMRRYGVKDAYEKLKDATRGEANVTREMIAKAIDSTPEIPDVQRVILKALTPRDYIGLASRLVVEFIKQK